MDSVTVRWCGNRQFVGWDEAGHSVVMDASAPSTRARAPACVRLQLFLYALAGCTGMDVISILEKKRQDVRGLEIEVEATQREDEFPKIYTDIHLHYVVTGYGVTDAAVESRDRALRGEVLLGQGDARSTGRASRRRSRSRGEPLPSSPETERHAGQ